MVNSFRRRCVWLRKKFLENLTTLNGSMDLTVRALPTVPLSGPEKPSVDPVHTSPRHSPKQ